MSTATEQQESPLKFVDSWLFKGARRKSAGLPWPGEMISDAAAMIADYTSELREKRDALAQENQRLRAGFEAILHVGNGRGITDCSCSTVYSAIAREALKHTPTPEQELVARMEADAAVRELKEQG